MKSSDYRFEGEDINKKERKNLQTVQQRTWLIQQMSEKKQLEDDQKMSERIYTSCMSTREIRALHLSELEKDCKREIAKANKAYNEALVIHF